MDLSHYLNQQARNGNLVAISHDPNNITLRDLESIVRWKAKGYFVLQIRGHMPGIYMVRAHVRAFIKYVRKHLAAEGLMRRFLS